MDYDKAGVGSHGIRLLEIGAHCTSQKTNVSRLGRIFGMHECVSMLVVPVAGGGVDAGELLGPRIPGEKD